MISYSLEDSGIFDVKFSGIISLNDVNKFLSDFDMINYLPQDIMLLYDLREANLNFNTRDIWSISEMTNKATSSYNSVRTAILVNKPNSTAYSILFAKESSHKIIRKVFSTVEAAIAWLKKTNIL